MKADLVLIDMKHDGAALALNGQLLVFDEAAQPFSVVETLAQFGQRLAKGLDTTLHTCTTTADAVCGGREREWSWKEVVEFVFNGRPGQPAVLITG